MISRLSAAMFLGVLSTLASAQDSGGALSGRVVDPDGRPVTRPEAQITVKDAAGRQFTGRVARDGTYQVRKLPAGTYSIDLDMPTRLYEHYSRAAVAVAGNAATTLELRLSWGMNLGTVGDDPLLQGSDLRAKTKNINGPVPRMPDGRPDLSGIWSNIGDAYAGAAPMQPWAQSLYDEWMKIKQDNPGAYCLPQSGLMTLTNYPYKFVQTPKLIVQLVEDMAISHRQIFMDGRGHPDPDAWNPSWYGHSIGHWEGDTLVVDTTGFNESTPGFGIHTESLHITEKYTRTSYGRMNIEITAEDPKAYTGPWVRERQAGLVEDSEIVEFLCAEGKPTQAATRAPWKARP
jgi:Carboxypeptidase regulatory-like domain